MGYVKLVIGLVALSLFVAILHYFLPQRDIVRILSTEVVRVDDTATQPDGTVTTISRDMRQVSAAEPDGGVRVFRNEDASLYFKFDSADLGARADELTSTRDSPIWVVVKHYGWRVQFMSWFPNLISIREAESKDEPLSIWPNVMIVSGIVLFILVTRRIFLILIARYVDPVIDSVEEEIDQRTNAIGRFFRRIRRFFGGA
ncbi:MAG: DUF1523 family protein [Pseudomonadota bacterium]